MKKCAHIPRVVCRDVKPQKTMRLSGGTQILRQRRRKVNLIIPGRGRRQSSTGVRHYGNYVGCKSRDKEAKERHTHKERRHETRFNTNQSGKQRKTTTFNLVCVCLFININAAVLRYCLCGYLGIESVSPSIKGDMKH